jgi:predicted RNA binding protein YcfA (HicA-like mRNA interferase family)
MPTFGPIKREKFMRYLKELGFSGPYPGGKHLFMERGDFRLRLPNPHQGDIGRSLLAALLREAGISREEWEKL